MNVKSFFNKLMGKKQEAAEAAPAPTTPPENVKTVSVRRNTKSHVVIRHGQRRRGFGAKRADGRWMSPFDIWLLKKQGMEISSVRRVFGHKAVNWAMAR